MGRLIYIANTSVDGYTEDAQGQFNWTEPSDEVFSSITELIRPVGTYLMGRRMYETMAVWETEPSLAAASELMAEFAGVWQAAEKVVYSSTLHTALTARTRIEAHLDVAAVRDLKRSAQRDLTIGGPELAAHAMRAGLVDECHLFIYPVVVGAGKQAFPDDLRLAVELLEERRYPDGVVNLRYRVHPR
jgi:dihydrofolate reductase